MKRREFIAGLGGAAAWPLAAQAQRPAIPVIGYLSAGSPVLFADRLRAFRQSLSETGFVNVAIDYRWAGDELDRLPALAADLVRRQVNVISAFGGINGALAAKAATTTIPIAFGTDFDPIAAGLVASLNRPGGNITGVVTLGVEVAPKRMELMHVLLPTATLAVFINPARPTADAILRDLQTAARPFGQPIQALRASNEREIDAAFAILAELRAAALVIANDAYFNTRTQQFAALTLRYAVPTIYQLREFAAAGGLMSYGSSITETYRIVGGYTGRILKGEKPADLPLIFAPVSMLHLSPRRRPPQSRSSLTPVRTRSRMASSRVSIGPVATLPDLPRCRPRSGQSHKCCKICPREHHCSNRENARRRLFTVGSGRRARNASGIRSCTLQRPRNKNRARAGEANWGRVENHARR
jgi:putative ABC transport system substrate-binding protein